MMKKILSANNLNNAMIKLEKALPCLLHLENRSSAVMIWHLLRGGLELCKGNEEAKEQLVRAVQRIVNKEMFGEPGAPSNWQFSMGEDGRIGDLKLANWRARCIVHHINSVVNICITDDHEKEQWMDAFQLYRVTMEVGLFESFAAIHVASANLKYYLSSYSEKALSQKADFTDDEIDSFQAKADDYFSK